jgi:ABC-type transport system involved in cytochrome c biogenesis permease subunit
MTSTFWYNVCAVGYFTALFVLIANLVMKRAKVRRIATVIAASSFIAQTVGMAFRWHEAGLVEVAAIERAQDVKLSGLGYLVAYTQHPPWSNLYEIMVFMAWGVVLVFLVSEVKWRIRLAGVFALIIALTALGLASLTTDATIKPLVPALQSWWIMIHVISSAVGYSAGTMGAVLSLLYLIKARDKVSLTAVGGGSMVLAAVVYLVLGRGFELFKTGAYRVKLMGTVDGKLEAVGAVVDGAFRPYYVASPGVGYLLIATILVSIAAAVVMLMNRKSSDTPTGAARIAYFAAFGLSTLTLLLVLANAFTQTDFQVPAEMAAKLTHGAPPPWRLHITSAQWDLALFGIMWGGQFFVTLSILKPHVLRDLLPDANRLDRGAYYTILISFALVAVVLVTGALWAHYAWGRYWGWDPKETGALVIWLTYAIYIHSRMTYGWVGVPSAVIGIVGFFVIIAGFLGVNLGWFADGLHSYGSA